MHYCHELLGWLTIPLLASSCYCRNLYIHAFCIFALASMTRNKLKLFISMLLFLWEELSLFFRINATLLMRGIESSFFVSMLPFLWEEFSLLIFVSMILCYLFYERNWVFFFRINATLLWEELSLFSYLCYPFCERNWVLRIYATHFMRIIGRVFFFRINASLFMRGVESSFFVSMPPFYERIFSVFCFEGICLWIKELVLLKAVIN